MLNQQGKVKFVKGSILMPQTAGLRFVLSFASMSGTADGPLHEIFSKKWVKVRQDAKGWYANKNGAYKLGALQQTAVQSDTVVLHLLCKNEKGEVDVEGLKLALKAAEKLVTYEHGSVHVSNHLVSECAELKELMEEALVSKGLCVTYYEE